VLLVLVVAPHVLLIGVDDHESGVVVHVRADVPAGAGGGAHPVELCAGRLQARTRARDRTAEALEVAPVPVLVLGDDLDERADDEPRIRPLYAGAGGQRRGYRDTVAEVQATAVPVVVELDAELRGGAAD